MTRKFQDAEVRQLYEWWRDGAISLREAARTLGCEVRTVQRRFAKWDEETREKIHRRNAADWATKSQRSQ